MSNEHFTVKNVKCGGCASNIMNGLKELPGVDGVEVSIESGEVNVTGEGLSRQQISEKLTQLGYPEA